MTGRLRSFGPALIVASVVLGPGSILTASRVGTDFAYELVWVVVAAAILMVGATALSAHLGSTLARTPCEEIAARAGRAPAALVGAVLFLVVACFQFSNNVGVVAAAEPFMGAGGTWPIVLVVAINLAALAALFGLARLYAPVERLMKVLVGAMIVGFVGNLLYARPSPTGILAGLLPGLPEGLEPSLVPRRGREGVVDPLLPVVGLIGTTFSVAGAFYQSYLVRKKGWGAAELRRGRLDSLLGIGVLGFLTLTVLSTAAAVLHGRVSGAELETAADVARQLEPLFGAGAKVLFCVGLFAGAFSSFLVNAMIGGTVFSDGLGLGGDMDGRWPKRLTALALIVGMGIAIAVQGAGWSTVELILFAQALTVLGNPILAGVLLWLALRPGRGQARAPLWTVGLAATGLVVVVVLAARTALRVYLQVSG